MCLYIHLVIFLNAYNILFEGLTQLTKPLYFLYR